MAVFFITPHCFKYLGILIDDKLAWYEYVIKLRSQPIGVFKKILLYLSNDVAFLYYNAFILPCFSYCTVVWFNNAHSSKQKLIDKIDKIISFLAIKNKLNTHEFINHLHVYDIWKIFKLQSVSLMHDGSIGHNNFEFICMILYKNIQDHYTRGSTKVHIITVSSLDTRNFVYHCILN